MSKQTYQLITWITLPLPVCGAYVIGRPLAAWLSSLDDEVTAMLMLLGYVLGLLVAVVIWGVCLLPLRARAGYTPITQDLAQVKAEGLRNAFEREQAALKERERSQDPAIRASHHRTMAGVAAMLSLAALAMTWALFEDGIIMTLPLGALLVCPPLGVYHLVQSIRARPHRA